MSSSVSVEAARLELMLTELRLPTIKWAAIAALAEHEIGKTFESAVVMMQSAEGVVRRDK